MARRKVKAPEPEGPRRYRPHGAGSVVKSTDRRGVVTFRPRIRRGERTYWGVGVSVTVERDAEAAREEALANLEDLRESLKTDVVLDPRKVRATLSAWVRHHWYAQLEDELPEDAHHRTLATYKWATDNWVLPYIGHLRVTEVSVPAIQRWRDEITRKGASRNTIRFAEGRLRQALRAAVVAGYDVQDGVFKAKHVAVRRSDRPFVTPEQLQTLLAAMPDPFWRQLWRVHFGLATRYSEVSGLQWGDWQREQRAVQLLRQVDSKTNEVRSRPKDDSRGALPLTLDATAALEERFADVVAKLGHEPAPTDFVFSRRKGEPVRYATALVQIKATIAVANKAGAGIDDRAATHALRHGHAQVLLEAEVPLSIISRKLRHKSEETTLRYLHGLSAEGLRGTAEAVDRRQAPRE